MDWKIVSVAIGVLGALAGVYFREAVRKAQEQKRVALRLSAHLSAAYRAFEDTPTEQLMVYGVAVYERLKAAVAEGDAAYKKTRAEIDEAKKTVLKKIDDKEDVAEYMGALIAMQSLGYDALKAYIEQMRTSEERLLQGIQFISDEDASHLPMGLAYRAMQIRSDLSGILNEVVTQGELLLCGVSTDAAPIKRSVKNMVRHVFGFMEQYYPTRKAAMAIARKSVLSLAADEMLLK